MTYIDGVNVRRWSCCWRPVVAGHTRRCRQRRATVRLTLADRACAFILQYPDWPGAWPHLSHEQGRDVLYATWVLGQNYQNRNPLYGSYPPGYLERVTTMFPDARGKRQVLHAFSGSLRAGPYSRLDLVKRGTRPELLGTVYDVAKLWRHRERPALVIADPPYSPEDAQQYGTPAIDRLRATSALASVEKPCGHLAWLDCVWPMHSKREWLTVGRITVIRSTNHRVRLLTLFQRV